MSHDQARKMKLVPSASQPNLSQYPDLGSLIDIDKALVSASE